jgi:hypothetical protein
MTSAAMMSAQCWPTTPPRSTAGWSRRNRLGAARVGLAVDINLLENPETQDGNAGPEAPLPGRIGHTAF